MRKASGPTARSELLFFLLLLIALPLLFEMVLRLVFPVPEVSNFNRIDYSAIIRVPGKASAHLEHAAFTWSSQPDGASFVHHLNLYGFRDRDWKVERESGWKRAIFIGDSLVEGFMASDDETIPAGFSRAAKAGGVRIEVLNMGVGGSDIPAYFQLIGDAVPLFKPDYLFLVFYENDFADVPDLNPVWLSDSLVPEYSGHGSRAWSIVNRIRKGQAVPRAWHSRPFPFVAPVPDPRNPWSLKRNANYFRKFVSPGIAAAIEKGLFNPFTVNSYGVRRRTLRKSFDILPHLTALKRFVEDHSGRLFVAYIPDGDQVSDAYLPFHSEYSVEKHPSSLMGEDYQLHARILESACARAGIRFLDLTPMLRARESAGEHLFWNYDGHLKGGSYLLVGRTIFDWFGGVPDEGEGKSGSGSE